MGDLVEVEYPKEAFLFFSDEGNKFVEALGPPIFGHLFCGMMLRDIDDAFALPYIDCWPQCLVPLTPAAEDLLTIGPKKT